MLEYYVLGLLSEQESAQVEGYLMQFPELKKDHFEIQQAVRQFAIKTGINPERNLEADIIKTIRAEGKKETVQQKSSVDKSGSANTNNKNRPNYLMYALFGALLLAALWFANEKYNDYTQLQQEYVVYKSECDSIQNAQAERLRLYDQLNDPDNRTLSLSPTENYQETNLLFHFNPVKKQNYIQIKNLPEIETNQTFQLWSLKADTPPIPLTIFKTEDGFVVPVDFEDDTDTYAITIEAAGGAEVPTLARLIGTIGIA